MDKSTLYWNIYNELRKEVIESQKIRTQVTGFKITFVSAAAGLIGTNLDKIPSILLVLPAFAAIFFDFLIISYSFSIKRIGYYIYKQIEPNLRTVYKCDENFLFWEEFMNKPIAKQDVSFFGHIGITSLAVAAGVIALCFPFHKILSSILILILSIFFIVDLRTFYFLRNKFRKKVVGEKLEENKLK